MTLNCYNVISADNTGVYVHVKNPDNKGNNYLVDPYSPYKPKSPSLGGPGFPPLPAGPGGHDLWLPRTSGQAAVICVTQDIFLDEKDGLNILLKLWDEGGKLKYVLLPYYPKEEQEGGSYDVSGDLRFQVIIEKDKVTILGDSKFSDKGPDRKTFFLSKSLKEYAKRYPESTSTM
eukprot:jgi/Botrbrau1/23509/Bobra.106_1s0060.1